MRIFLVDVQPDRFAIRAVLANDSYECRNLIMQEYNEYKAKPSIRIYASYELAFPKFPRILYGEQ